MKQSRNIIYGNIILSAMIALLLMNKSFSQVIDNVIDLDFNNQPGTRVFDKSAIAAARERLKVFENIEDYDEKERRFPILEKEIKSLQEPSDRDLLLARLYLNATSFFDKKDINILSLLEGYLNKNPKSSEAYYLIAVHHFKEINYGSIDLVGLGLDWSNFDNKELEALEKVNNIIDKCLGIDANYSDAYLLRGKISKGDSRKDCFKKAIECDPSNVAAWDRMIKELIFQKKYDEAEIEIAHWSGVIGENNVLLKLYSLLSELKLKKRDLEGAESSLKNALSVYEDDKDNSFAGLTYLYRKLAELYTQKSDFKKAEEYYQYCLKISPKDWWNRIELASLYQNQQKNDLAIVEYEQVLAYVPDYGPALFNLGLIHQDLNREKAKKYFLDLIEIYKERDDADSMTLVNKAKTSLYSLGVREFPKSKKELMREWMNLSAGILVSVVVFFVGYKYRRFARVAVLLAMVVTITAISADYDDISEALLKFVPVFAIGGFLFYLLKDKK